MSVWNPERRPFTIFLGFFTVSLGLANGPFYGCLYILPSL